MSRQKEEFTRRTSIFEGAFRAWSHLAQLDPASLQSKSVVELLDDPALTNPISSNNKCAQVVKRNADGSARPTYPYEALPRTGLHHPYVKAILTMLMGGAQIVDTNNAAVIKEGLKTLRYWWQHRRNGENKTAVKLLGTEKMRNVVDDYTRHFFHLAYSLVVNNQSDAQPPKTLQDKLKELEKKKSQDSETTLTAATLSAIEADLTDPDLSPLERMYAAQKRYRIGLLSSSSSSEDVNTSNPATTNVNTEKLIQGKIDMLPGLLRDAATTVDPAPPASSCGLVANNDQGGNHQLSLNDVVSLSLGCSSAMIHDSHSGHHPNTFSNRDRRQGKDGCITNTLIAGADCEVSSYYDQQEERPIIGIVDQQHPPILQSIDSSSFVSLAASVPSKKKDADDVIVVSSSSSDEEDDDAQQPLQLQLSSSSSIASEISTFAMFDWENLLDVYE